MDGRTVGRRRYIIAALTASGWLWAPNARAQAAGERVLPCPQRWIYEPPPTTAYLSPLYVSDSAGDVFWWENTGPAELVAVRDGRTRWRRRLSTLMRGPFMVTASLMRDDLLIVSFESTVEGLRTSDGRIVWSHDLQADLSSELRNAGLPKNTELATSAAARVGRALVTATAAGYSGAWLTATAPDGRPVWRRHIDGAVARMVADGDRLFMVLSQAPANRPPIIAVDSNGKEVFESRVPFGDSMAVSGGEVVFDRGYVVTARIAPMPGRCPPGAPCQPPPFMLTVTGFSAGQERWHLSHAVGDARVALLLLSDSAVLFVDNQRVGRISPDGKLTQLCELPVDGRGSVAGLVNGDLVVAYHQRVAAYTLPGAPKLAATGWVMHGAGPAQGWAVRAASVHGLTSASVSAAPFVRFPAGVADPTAQVAYVQSNGGATIALALADGTERWRTQSRARPVGIWNGRVVVLEQPDTLASVFQVAQLDPVSGAEVEISQPIPVPDWGWGRPTLAPWGEPLMTDVRIEGEAARLSWEIAINGWPGGATIRPYTTSGFADVDLRSGAISLSPIKRVEGAKPISSPPYPFAAVVDGRKFTLLYAATATLTATDAESGKRLWTRQLWSIAVPKQIRVPPP